MLAEENAMSNAENKALVRRYIEEIVNTGDVSRITEFVSPDYFETGNTSGQSRGIDGARQHVIGVRQTYRDLHVTIEQQFAEGD
jgi:hypothetical protein